MQKNSDNFSIQEALKLASTPSGQELIAALRQNDMGQIQKAAELANAGDYTQAQRMLSNLLQDPNIQSLLSKHGR